MARPRQIWQNRVESDWTLGIIRDTARTGIPVGGVYNAIDMLLYKPGVAFKRGGIIQGTFAAGSGTGLIATLYANFPGIGGQLIAVTGGTFLVDELTESARVGHGVITGFTNIIDPPTLFVGGSQNVVVFCDSTGTKIPWFYNGGDDVQEFQGGNSGAPGDYSLAITGNPTSGAFKLAAQDLVSGFSYVTAAIDWDASFGDVQTALEAAAPNTFVTSGGDLPGTQITITVPTDWAVSVLPAAVSGVSLGGGTDPKISLGPVDGTSTGVPTAIHSTVHLQRLILANSSVYPNRLWFGPLLNPTGGAWNMAESWWDMDAAVSGMASLSNQLLVFSYDTMWRIIGDTPPPGSNMTLEPIGHVGCTDARSIVLLEGQCIFANPKGVYVTTGVGYESLFVRPDGISTIESYWQSLFDGYDPATWTISCGLYGRRFLVVTLLDADDTLVKTFLCDLSRRAWVELTQPRARMYANVFGSSEEVYAATMDFSYLMKLGGIFTPLYANRNDAIGAFGCSLETRPLAYSPGLKAFGDAHLSYDMRATDTGNKVMKTDGTSGNAYVTFDLLSNEPEVWVTARLRFSSAARAFWDAGNPPTLMVLDAPIDIAEIFTVGLPGDGYGSANDAGAAGNVVAGTWATVEYHYENGVIVEVYVDGNLEATGSEPSAGGYGDEDVSSLLIGQVQIFADAASIVYYDYVNMGTTQLGTDLFSDDFSSGNLAAWTSTDGDVTVVADPF